MSLIKRYQKLGYSDSIPKIYRYPFCCKELSFLLRHGYSQFPKNLQALIFQDVLTAFRLLSGMQTRNAVSEARLLYQSVEASLPKQKKSLAAAEFKQAMIAHKRSCKTCQKEKGSFEFPLDVLIHIFGFLDLKSLASVASVCWSWNIAATDDVLWRAQFDAFFGNSDIRAHQMSGGMSRDWREVFKGKYRRISTKNLTTDRGYCGNCRTIVWNVNMRCPNEYCNRRIKPVSLSQILRYISDDSVTAINCSEEDGSDSEEDSPRAMYKHWAIPFAD